MKQISKEAIVLKIEVDTVIDDMFFTEEMAENIGNIVTISKPVEYMKDFYTIEGDDNYNAYHISWLYFITQQTKLNNEIIITDIPQDIEGVFKELEGEYDISGFHIRSKETHSNLINTLKQYIANLTNPISDVEVEEALEVALSQLEVRHFVETNIIKIRKLFQAQATKFKQQEETIKGYKERFEMTNALRREKE